MTPFTEVISIYDLLNQIINGSDLYTIGQLAKVNKITLNVMSNEKLWETLYRKNLMSVPHLNMETTWLTSFGFNYSLIGQVVSELTTEFCLVKNSPFINTNMLKQEVRRIIITFMSNSEWLVKKPQFAKLYTRVQRALVGLNGTKNVKFKICSTRDVLKMKHNLLSLLSTFGYDVSRV